MKTLVDHINEHCSMPVFPPNKLKTVWDKIRNRIGDDFDDEILNAMDNKTLNTVLWKIDTKYNLHIMK